MFDKIETKVKIFSDKSKIAVEELFNKFSGKDKIAVQNIKYRTNTAGGSVQHSILAYYIEFDDDCVEAGKEFMEEFNNFMNDDDGDEDVTKQEHNGINI